MGTNWRKTKAKKRTTKISSTPFELFLHPLSPFGHLTYVRLILVFLGVVWLAGPAAVSAPATGTQNAGGTHAHDFLIFATVFTNQGFALPGARIRVRHVEEKKFRWEAVSDHRGELGIRVARGGEYEMTIEAKGFKPESRRIDAREDNRTDLTIQMEPVGGGKR